MQASCLCGSVRFEIRGEIPAPDACHCQACRKWSGNYLVSADIPKANLRLESDQTLRWFSSSEKVRRGFCEACGSSLFWDPIHHDWIGVALGSLDAPSGTKLGLHIFVSQKGDYYELADGVEQRA